MTDLIKRLRDFGHVDAYQAAGRIEELVKDQKQGGEDYCALMEKHDALHVKLTKAEEERDGYLAERNKFQLYLQRTHADLELEVAAVEALNAKLAKAVDTLEYYAVEALPWEADDSLQARATLAVIKGGNDAKSDL